MLKVLARGITAMTVFAAFVAAGSAVAGDPPPKIYSADFEYGGSISFVLDSGAESKKVRDIEIAKIRADCGEGRTAELDFNIYGSTPVVSDRSFAVRSETKKGVKAIVRGEFSRRYTSAKGTARVHGKYRFAGETTRSDCDTGKQKFVARVTG